MSKSIFIKEIILSTKEPRLCPSCNKEDKLQRDIIIEDRSEGLTFLCSRCEALTIVTNHHLKKVELSSRNNNDIIMLKEPYLIRRVEY